MKNILLTGQLIWEALQAESGDFDVLWEVLQSQTVQGYITQTELDALYCQIAQEQDVQMAFGLISQLQRVLLVYSPDRSQKIDIEVNNSIFSHSVAIELAEAPVLSLHGFLERYALSMLYANDSLSEGGDAEVGIGMQQWYRKWRQSGFDMLWLIPLMLTIALQGMPFFQKVVAELFEMFEDDSLSPEVAQKRRRSAPNPQSQPSPDQSTTDRPAESASPNHGQSSDATRQIPTAPDLTDSSESRGDRYPSMMPASPNGSGTGGSGTGGSGTESSGTATPSIPTPYTMPLNPNSWSPLPSRQPSPQTSSGPTNSGQSQTTSPEPNPNNREPQPILEGTPTVLPDETVPLEQDTPLETPPTIGEQAQPIDDVITPIPAPSLYDEVPFEITVDGNPVDGNLVDGNLVDGNPDVPPPLDDPSSIADPYKPDDPQNQTQNQLPPDSSPSDSSNQDSSNNQQSNLPPSLPEDWTDYPTDPEAPDMGQIDFGQIDFGQIDFGQIDFGQIINEMSIANDAIAPERLSSGSLFVGTEALTPGPFLSNTGLDFVLPTNPLLQTSPR